MPTSQNKAFLRVLSCAFALAAALCVSGQAGAQAAAGHQVHSTAKKPAARHKTVPARKTTVAARQTLRPASGKVGGKVKVALRQGPLHSAPSVQPSGSFPAAQLRSEAALVVDLETSTVLYDKNSTEVRPIASISKLMTALIIAESGQAMDEMLRISDDDVDRLRHSRSRLAVGTRLSRADMLHLALMSSENRAANALGRYYPGGMPAFVRAMNDKARSLGMRHTHFVEPTGLSNENVSTPRDLAHLLRAVGKQPLIHRYTTNDTYQVTLNNGRHLIYNNTNRLVKNSEWDIKISKTGFINEAGECLVMITRIEDRDVAMVFLNSNGRYSRIGDAVRMRNYVEKETTLAML